MRLFGGDPQRKQNARMIKEIRQMIKAKQYDTALVTATKYLQEVPDNHDVLFVAGSIHYMRRQYATAIGYFERALQIGRYDTEVLALKAQCHHRLGQSTKAKMCWMDILEVDPANAEAKKMLDV